MTVLLRAAPPVHTGAPGAMRFALPIAILAACAFSGCVERTVTIRTEPEGATVLLNNDEVGRTPIRAPFTWYGDYDVTIRKPGYKTLKTHHRIDAPWYQLPGIDIFAECFSSFTIYDRRELPVYTLEPAVASAPEEVIGRAEELRDRALFAEK